MVAQTTYYGGRVTVCDRQEIDPAHFTHHELMMNVSVTAKKQAKIENGCTAYVQRR